MSLSNPLTLSMVVSAALSLVFLIAAIVFIDKRKKRLITAIICLLLGSLMLSLSALCATITVAVRGYRALTREDLAATVKVEPMGTQQFWAEIKLPDGTMHSFALSGDEFYIDAHILKWKPWANILGLHTSYELDRIAGRYTVLADETTKPRTVHSLSADKPFNMFDLRRKYEMLNPLLDAEYGSATFINTNTSEEFQVMVSTSGLLIRKVEKEPGKKSLTQNE